jgi:hypothetical protein
LRRASLADATEINLLLNDPAIRPTIGGEGELDCTKLLSDERNICLLAENGGALFAWHGPGVFEGHSFFRARGREALRLGARMLDAIFASHAEMIWGLTPEENRAARWFNRQLGFRSLGMMRTPDGLCELFEMRGR